MSDDRSEVDGESIDRRTVLKSAAAGAVGVGGLVATGAGDSAAADLEDVIRTQGELTPAEAARKLRQLDDFDGLPDQDDPCYTDTKCAGGCGYQGAVAHRTCCPQLGGCGEWNYTNLCC